MTEMKTDEIADRPASSGGERLYAPSWVDRIHDWTEKRSAHAPVDYLTIGLVLTLVQSIFLWLERGPDAAALLPVVLFNAFIIPILLALLGFLDGQAVVALDAIRPMLDVAEDAIEVYRFKLANMPARWASAWGLGMLGVVILMEQVWITPDRYATLAGLPVFAVLFQVVDKAAAILYGMFIYHTIRQLRLVNAIHAWDVRINLFNLRPLQAFSRLTGATAVGLVAGVYGWMLINPELLADPVSIGIVALITAAAASAFVLPLVGVHRRIAAEKERSLRDLDRDFEDVSSKFIVHIRTGDFEAAEAMNGAMAGLEIHRGRIEALPTWPWRPETAQFSLTTIALPLALAIIRFLVERAFGS
jgi:hypothetical protein